MRRRRISRQALWATGLVGLLLGPLASVALSGPALPAGAADGRLTATATVHRADSQRRAAPLQSAGTLLASLADPGAGPVDEFGNSVAISGSVAVVGSASADARAGAAYIYVKGASGWPATPAVTLTDPGATSGDGFGSSVAISTKYIVIGAIDADGDGAAYVYVKNPSGWPTTPKLTLTDPVHTALDWFGSSVAVSGSAIVVGAFGTDSGAGAAYVYDKGATGWPTAPSATFSDPAATANDSFGTTVSISGTTAVIGAYNTTVGGELGAGAAYLYAKTASGWPATPTATFDDPANTAYAWFGTGVAISGSTVVIGSWGNGEFSGLAYIYTEGASGWPTQPTTTLPNPAKKGYCFFGYSVAVSGTIAVVGGYGTGSDQGTAYVYAKGSSGWPTAPAATLTDPSGQTYSYFGNPVADSGSNAVVGAYGSDSGAGAAYLYST